MEAKRLPQNCRWAEPTLYQSMPYWVEAWNTPWSCKRDGEPRVLAATTECHDCPRWEARQGDGVAWDFAPLNFQRD